MKDSWDWLWALGAGLLGYIFFQLRKKDAFEAPLPDPNSKAIRELKKRLAESQLRTEILLEPVFTHANSLEEELEAVMKKIDTQQQIVLDESNNFSVKTGCFGSILRDRKRLREAFVLKEIMDKPIALR